MRGPLSARVTPAAYYVTFFGGRRRDMEKNRLEAFSDGVIAVIITIMVL